MNPIVITMSLPDRRLGKNKSIHWRDRARLTKASRELSMRAAWPHAPMKPFARARLDIHFRLKTQVQPDIHNLTQWAHATIDGLADAGIVENDRDFEVSVPTWSRVAKIEEGMEITITDISPTEAQ